MAYLLDTNVCIDFALGRSPALLRRMEAAERLAMSAITFSELSVGALASCDPAGDRQRLAALVDHVEVLPFDRAAGARYGVLIREIGLKRHSFDRLIAAHALALGLALVTNNERDFADIPGLIVENWTLTL